MVWGLHACALGDEHGLRLAGVQEQQRELGAGAGQVHAHGLASNHMLGARSELHSRAPPCQSHTHCCPFSMRP